MASTKTFIILDRGGEGIPVNMAFALDVEYGGDFASPTADQLLTVFIYQAVQTNAAGSGLLVPRYIAFKFDSANLARAAIARINEFLIRNELAEDLRLSRVQIAGIAPASVVSGVATTVALTGGIFEQGGVVTINATTPVACVTTFIDGMNTTFVTDVTIPPGTYDVEYTTLGGQVAVLAGGITFT